MAIAGTLFSCSEPKEKMNDTPLIGRNTVEIKDGHMTPEALWAMGRLSDAQLSPNQQQVLYGVSYYSVKENKSNRELFIMNVDGSGMKQLTKTPDSEYNARWINDNTIAFIAASKGQMQLFTMNTDGSHRQSVSNIAKGIEAFVLSPDMKAIVFVSSVKNGSTVVDKYPDLPQASGRLVSDLMYKHWDEWVDEIPHPFVASFDGKTLSNIHDILEGTRFESPMRPFGGIEQIAFSADSKQVAYTCRKKTGLEYALSTNSDIYLYDIAQNKTVKNLSIGNMGYDINPTFSPDGEKIAWESMERDGYESDKNRIMVLNLKTGKLDYISKEKDQSFAGLVWDKNSTDLYATSTWHGTTQLYRANIVNKQFQQITTGVHDYAGINGFINDNTILATRHSMSHPDDLYAVDIASGKQAQLTNENKAILDQIEMGQVEERWIETVDHKQMQVWVIYPPKFDKTKKYPTLLYCEGGPQSPVSQFWSYRWNFQMMASNDYIIVAPNRRGLYGYGQEWLEEISGDYAGLCMQDYFSAIDALKLEPYVDETRLGAVGASFGGYSVYWLAGHHDKRFKAFIAHDGMFNLEAQYLETEEMWFANWDLGGPYWEKNNPVVKKTYANSPHNFVDQWDTPILIIHGEKDYRILASQGMSAFDAAVLRGVPAELLLYPDENHWVLKPQNGILWQRTFFEWLDRYLKN